MSYNVQTCCCTGIAFPYWTISVKRNSTWTFCHEIRSSLTFSRGRSTVPYWIQRRSQFYVSSFIAIQALSYSVWALLSNATVMAVWVLHLTSIILSTVSTSMWNTFYYQKIEVETFRKTFRLNFFVAVALPHGRDRKDFLDENDTVLIFLVTFLRPHTCTQVFFVCL